MASIAKYKEDNKKLRAKLDNSILSDEDTQNILDQIDENNRIIEELSKKEKVVIPIRGKKVTPMTGKKTHKSDFIDGNKIIIK